MTKVEELRDDLDELIESSAAKVLTKDQFLDFPGFDKIVLDLIAAARAEGAEAEDNRLYARGEEAECYNGNLALSLDGGLHGTYICIPADAFSDPLPVFALAPDVKP